MNRKARQAWELCVPARAPVPRPGVYLPLRRRAPHRLGREMAVSRSSTSMANTRQLRHTRPATHTCR